MERLHNFWVVNDGAVEEHGRLAMLALTCALQAADDACVQALLPHAASMLKIAQQLEVVQMLVLACEWCGVLAMAWLWRAAEQLQMPCSCVASAGASAEQQSMAQVAAGAAALLIPHIVVDHPWAREMMAVATKAVCVLASSAVGRQALAATDGSWDKVVAALWNDVAMEDDEEVDNFDERYQAAAVYLRGLPVSNILRATARGAAAAGEEPPFLQHLLQGLKSLQDDPDTAEGQDADIDAVHAHYRWLICQCCSSAGSCRTGLLAIAPLKPLLVHLLPRLPPGDDTAALEVVMAAAEAAVQDVRCELQQAQLAVHQACRDVAAAHIARRAVVQQLALFDACLQRLAARKAQASQLEQQLLRATACVNIE
jgi:hypothetical protein